MSREGAKGGVEGSTAPRTARWAVAILVPVLVMGATLVFAAGSAFPRADFDEGRRFDAEEVLKAFTAAWPERFSSLERLGSDWTVRLDSTLYRWAGGRLLPADSPGQDSSWSPWPFYPYTRELPPVRSLSAEEKRDLGAMVVADLENPEKRNPAFFDQLWHAPSRSGAWDRMKTIRFLGREVLVNPDILEELAAVERGLKEAARTDREVAAWIAGIGSVEGYVWRTVAGTKSRSMHSYGIAIDIVPARTGGLAWYWLDARKSGLAWYELPHAKRIKVPARAVEIFERHGFVWGGKWFFWDLVHFEFRPEVLILNDMAPARQGSFR